MVGSEESRLGELPDHSVPGCSDVQVCHRFARKCSHSGAGEPSIVPVPAAIANAVSMRLGYVYEKFLYPAALSERMERRGTRNNRIKTSGALS